MTIGITERQMATYILYQRTDLQRVGKNRLLRRLVPYKTRVVLDAWLRCRTIIGGYEATIRRECEQILPFLPKEVKNILDIGCGTGGIAAFLYRTYSSAGPVTLYLADRERVDKDIYYGFRSTASAYNSFALSRLFLCRTGVPIEKLHTIDVDRTRLPVDVEFDLIVSLQSWGYHYPVVIYLDYVKSHLHPSGAAVLDCRRGTDGLEILRSRFGVTIIDEQQKYVRVRCQH